MNSRSAVLGLMLAAGMILTPALSASAIPGPSHSVRKEFRNCTELNKVYKHGVGKSGAKDKATSPVKNFTVNTAVYNQNKKSDRDNDGVACEKK
jgi:hypothetical protein